MKLHPAQVATELKNYKVFRNFKDEILFQICTMVNEVSFKKGDLILKEGEKNSKLFILREGIAEILLAGEVVAILQTPGDVMGEMSVVSQNEVSSTIRVSSDLKCFMLDSEDFAHVHPKDKDHFQFLIHKIYSTILCDRLVKTNEKARLFEISNRELYQAQRRLESTVDKSALLVEPDKKQLVLAKMAVGCTGVHLDAVSTVEEGRKLLQTKKYDAVIVDENGVELLSDVNSTLPGAQFIMMCSKSPKENLTFLFQNLNLKICITRDLEQRNLTTKLILATLGKVLNQDYFGIEKYLSWGVDVHTETLKASMQRVNLNEKMKTYFRKVGVRNTILDRVFTVAEEIMMNAVYDAPVD
jgi:CRP-like cAMP-binding protein